MTLVPAYPCSSFSCSSSLFHLPDPQPASLKGPVVKLADGDTITVLDSNNVQYMVRIAGIDAPEEGQPFGNASRKRLGELVARKEVRVEFNKHDRYGRIVGKVWVTPPDCPTCGKTLDVGLAQITTGMAWWYRKYSNEQSTEDQGRYEFAEQEAKHKQAWAMAAVQPNATVGIQKDK
jgi:endonuclease YncB( thermonuclease family)